MKRSVSRANLIAYTLTTLSVGILITTSYFLLNIKVIENWKLTVKQTDIHVGDTVVLESTYHKLRTTGSDSESIRYIICRNREKVWVRYELNRATANRAVGVGGTGIPVTIRRDIADVPTTCKFNIVISYKVLPFRTVVVTNDSNEFLVQPERTTEESSSVTSIVSTPSQVQLSSVVVRPVAQTSSSNLTPVATPAQSNNVQPATNSTGPTIEPTGLHAVPVLGRVLNLLGL
jgi:hypothetical protein